MNLSRPYRSLTQEVRADPEAFAQAFTARLQTYRQLRGQLAETGTTLRQLSAASGLRYDRLSNALRGTEVLDAKARAQLAEGAKSLGLTVPLEEVS